MNMRKFALVLLLLSFNCLAGDWSVVETIMAKRQTQTTSKMKLTPDSVQAMQSFLKSIPQGELTALKELQQTMPKTTLELLFAIQSRGMSKQEAQNMAEYLQGVPQVYHINNVPAFDENTSHIIGREWHEIDYSGEGMTWQKQQAKYAPYGITDFKTVANLKKFFPVESRLPYFRAIYDK